MARSSEREIRRIERAIRRGISVRVQSSKRGSEALDMSEYSGFSFGSGQQTNFVYLYVNGPDAGVELQLSIISLKKHFPGAFRITLIGDKPYWYDGHHVPAPRARATRDGDARMPWRDTQNKIILAANCAEIDEKFVWMMDDTFMLKPTTVAQMEQPHYDPWYRVNMKSTWHQLIRASFIELEKRGKTTLQMGTHLPHVFRKSKLKEMFEEYNFPGQLLLFDVLYSNHFPASKSPVPYAGTWEGKTYPSFLRRFIAKAKRSDLEAIDANFLNYASKCWTLTMRSWLEGALLE